MLQCSGLYCVYLFQVLDMSTLGHRKRVLASLRVPPDTDLIGSDEDFLDLTNPLVSLIVNSLTI